MSMKKLLIEKVKDGFDQQMVTILMMKLPFYSKNIKVDK
jgi:hypothetical protein